MKLKALSLLCLISFNTFAQVNETQEPEVIVEESSTLEISKVRIKDVKELVEKIGAENTCMDEYLNNLINDLSSILNHSIYFISSYLI